MRAWLACVLACVIAYVLASHMCVQCRCLACVSAGFRAGREIRIYMPSWHLRRNKSLRIEGLTTEERNPKKQRIEDVSITKK